MDVQGYTLGEEYIQGQKTWSEFLAANPRAAEEFYMPEDLQYVSLKVIIEDKEDEQDEQDKEDEQNEQDKKDEEEQ